MYPHYYHTGEQPRDPNADPNPPTYMPYTPPNGLPQESKLVTYMNHTATTPVNSLSHAMGAMNLEPASPMMNNVLVNEFVPVNFYATPPPPLMQEPTDNAQAPITIVTSTPQQKFRQENVGGTTYFYDMDQTHYDVPVSMIGPTDACMAAGGMCSAVVNPAPYVQHIYVPQPNPVPVATGLASEYPVTPEAVREELMLRNNDMYVKTREDIFPDLPKVGSYINLTPMKETRGVPMSFRALNTSDDQIYALRRLPSIILPAPNDDYEKWKQFDHPNVVKLISYISTTAFNDNSMILAYEYHPRSVTLHEKYLLDDYAPECGNGYQKSESMRNFRRKKPTTPDSANKIPEPEFWSILIQLTTALRQVHSLGLACTNLKPDNIIMTGSRVRIAWLGATGVPIDPTDIVKAQENDVTAFGQVAIFLATRSYYVNSATCMEYMKKNYSEDLVTFITYCITPSPARRCMNDLMPIIGSRFYDQIESVQRHSDVTENILGVELDNGRLLRLLIKLGVINERPELNLDPTWSETGDRYMLKLFRDYLFHTVNEDGRPWLDQAHIAYCLNQLDGGTSTKVELMTRDEQSVLVVSYAELKHCLEQAYEELMQYSP